MHRDWQTLGPVFPLPAAVPADCQAVVIAQTEEAQTQARTYAVSRGELALGRVWLGSNWKAILFCVYMWVPPKGDALGAVLLVLDNGGVVVV